MTCIAIPASTVGTLIFCVNGFLILSLLAVLMTKRELGIRVSLIMFCLAAIVVSNIFFYRANTYYSTTPAECSTIIGG